MRRAAVLLLLLVLPALLAAGCGGRTAARPAARPAAAPVETAVPARPTETAQRAAAPRCRAGSIRPAGADGRSVAAHVLRPTAAYRVPGGRRIARFGVRNVNGYPTVFAVLALRVDAACRPTWLRVQLPIRPNGATGWVRAADVRTTTVRTRIVVDLSGRRVWLYRDGRLVLTSRAAVGAAATPTPTGRYYVNQLLPSGDPAGPFGPGAVGISAFSPVLTDWVQGGPVAIHGTNEPWSIGRAVSNGCVRVPNAILRRLYAATPAGTPVVIHS